MWGKGGKKTVVNQSTAQGLDPASQAYVNMIRSRAMAGANVILGGPGGAGGVSPFFGGSFGPILNGGGGGAGGVPAAGSWFTGPQTTSVADQAAEFMNPYISNVVNATRGEFDHLRGQALTGANQEATKAGAFGGSRAAIMAGARMGELDRAQASQVANLYNTGWQNAVTQGTAYAEQQRRLRQEQLMEPIWRQQQALGLMNFGLGPVGYNTTVNGMTTEKGSANPWGDLFGAALTGFGIYSGMKR